MASSHGIGNDGSTICAERKIRYQEEYLLLSAYDVKEIILMTYATKEPDSGVIVAQMQYRHKQQAIRDVGRGPS